MGSVMSIAKLAAAIAAVSLLAGCTTVTSGNATKDPSFKPGDAIVSLLNPGNYPTAPKPGSALKPGPETGRIYDGERMGEYVVGPWEVDPQLLDIDVTSTGLLLDVRSVLSAALDESAQKRQFIYGFGSTRGTSIGADHNRGLQNIVLRFPNPEEAAAAAGEFYAQYPSIHEPSARLNVPVQGHPEARAFENTSSDGTFAAAIVAAHGPFVICEYATTQETADTSMQLATKALDLQARRISDFKPTDPSQFATMQTDPEGLLSRTVPTKDHIGNQGLWGPRGFLHFDNDPIGSSAALTEAGVGVISIRGTHVYETRDDAAATQLAAKLLATATKTQPGPAVQGLPSARCVTMASDRVRANINICFAAVGRWAFQGSSLQPFDATQKMASQYLLLTAK